MRSLLVLLLRPTSRLYFLLLLLFFVFVLRSCEFLVIVVGTTAESLMSDVFLSSYVTPVAKTD